MHFLKHLIPALVIFTAGSLLADRAPNVIIIYTDDHGWPDIGTVGIYKDLKTPHIDALAASGIRATNGYSSAP
ncbi:MAG: sulfatase-like hydrolase/transferase, partial [Akkermansiaceae bacterium]